MKSKSILYAAIAAVLSFASCSKEEQVTKLPEAKVLPSLQITVGDITGTINDGAVTKAAKTGWVPGDKINIWFDQASHKYGDDLPQRDSRFYPELILTWNGSTWVDEFSDFFDPACLKTDVSGRMRVIYESTNDIKSTFANSYSSPGSDQIYDRYVTAASKNYYRVPMIVSANVDYEYDSDSNKLTAAITGWKFLTKVQVLITGLKQGTSYYRLSAVAGDNSFGQLYSITGFQFSTLGNILPYDYQTSSLGAGGGTLTEDGVAFYFYDAVTPGEAKTYKFMLQMLMPPSTWMPGDVTFENKTINTSDDSITCIRIDKSKFSNGSLFK